ncbi:MAG: hypothetical protein VX438_06465, partial [Planctomycetota bacterium]|nr:hypothetical protein [Planctomycetota bacterium]
MKKIDLSKESGGQLHWAHCENRSSLNFLTHHAAADGIGGLQVVSDWLTAYHAMESAAGDPDQAGEKKLRRTDLHLLNHRENYGFLAWKFLKTLPRQALGILGVKEFLANQPVALIPNPLESVDSPIPEGY